MRSTAGGTAIVIETPMHSLQSSMTVVRTLFIEISDQEEPMVVVSGFFSVPTIS